MSQEPADNLLDLAVIGGGITGAGVARDAALRGLSCILLEMGDFSSGTSAKTTRLVHGGLRYLESGDLHLVSESLREREILLRLAPHLIHPMPILLPVYQGDRRKLWQVRAGLLLYDLLSMGKGTPHYAVLPARTTLRKAPFLASPGLVGAGHFYDYQIALPERLVLENIFSAREHGAYCLNHHEVVEVRDEGGAFALRCRDTLSGAVDTFRARTVVNATGPWADGLGGRYRPGLRPKIRPTKGTHLVLDIDLDYALFSGSTPDQRLFFTLPLSGFTLTGTTDTHWEGDPSQAHPTPEEVEYLLSGLRKLLPRRQLRDGDVLWAYSGVRPLAVLKKKGHPSELSRNHVLHQEGAGGRFLTIVGGKYTTYRKMAEETVDAVCKSLGRNISGTTDHAPLFGGGLGDRLIFREHLMECTRKLPNLPREVVDHLISMYGRRCCEVIELGIQREQLREPLGPGYADYKAQVVYAVRAEDAHHLDDVLLRRLKTGLSADLGLSAAHTVADLMATELGWSEAARREQIDAFETLVHERLLLGGGGRAHSPRA